jgi:hypothetical protein
MMNVTYGLLAVAAAGTPVPDRLARTPCWRCASVPK